MQSYQCFQCIGHTGLNTSGTNGPHSLSRVKVGTHSALLKGSHTTAHTAKHGVFWVRVVSLPSARSARSRTSPGRVSERRTLPLLGLGRGCSQRTQRASGQRCAYARRCSEASRPRWAALPRLQFGGAAFFRSAFGTFCMCEARGGITTLGAFHTFRKPCVAGV